MKRTLFLSAVATLIMATAFSQSKVYIIPVLHGMHQTNPQYTYDSIQAMVRRLNPDVIAVEIRAEDIGTDTAYLKQNYPYEMWMMPYWFPAVAIAGFDWLGQELEGKPIPPRYWKDHSRIKALQRLLDTDTVYTNKLAACRLYEEERLRILETASLKTILQSNDYILIKEYYNCLNQQLRGSDYEELPRFYNERNRHIQQNVQELARRHAGKTIVVLTGDDHYPYLREYLLRQKLSLAQPL
jgi:hypothetical protein